MNQWLLTGALQFVGMVILYATARKSIDRTTIILAGYPVGLLIWVTASLISLLTPLTFAPCTPIALTLGVTFIAVIFDALRRDDARPAMTVSAFVVGLMLFNTVSFMVHQVNFAYVTNDSFFLLITGRELGHFGEFTRTASLKMSGWGAFIPVAHATSDFLKEDYLYGMPQMLAVITIALLFHWIRRACQLMGNTGVVSLGAAILSVLLLISTPMFQRHASYIHTNLGSAAFLLLFAGAAYWHFSTGGRAWLALAVMSLIGFSLHRIEGPIVAAIFLAPIAECRDIRFIDRLLATLGVAIPLTIWYVTIAGLIGDHGYMLTREQIPFVLAPLWILVAIVIMSAFKPLRTVTDFTTLIMTWALLLVVAWLFIDKPIHMKKCLDAMSWNLAWEGRWSLTYTAVLIFLAWTPFMRTFNGESLFRATVPSFLLLIIALGAFRKPYRLSEFDSGNRIALHILPLIIFYLAIKFGLQFANRSDQTSSTRQEQPCPQA